MRIMQHAVLVSVVLALVGLSCGSGDDDKAPTQPGPPGTEARFLRARIDGVPWSVPPTGLSFGASHAGPGLYVIIGQPTGDYRLEFVLNNIDGVGTFPLGVSALCRGGTVTLSRPPATWRTPLSGAAGSISFTEVSDSLLIGTFQFTAVATPGSPSGTKNVTEGAFRLPITRVGAIGPIPDNAWSEVRATVNGSPWNAANIATMFVTSTLSIVAFNDTRTFTFTLADVQGPGTYALSNTSPVRSITGIGDDLDPLICCWGPYGSASGSVTITSITATRIRGTFQASLEAAPGSQASGTLVIASGTFDNGRPAP